MKKRFQQFAKTLRAPGIFFLKLLILQFALKSLFAWVNPPGPGEDDWRSVHALGGILQWSLSVDAFTLLWLCLPGFLCLLLASLSKQLNAIAKTLALWAFVLPLAVASLLNLADIFYFPFHRQRANADLLYVTGHPFQKTFVQNPGWTILALLIAGLICLLLFRFALSLVRQLPVRKSSALFFSGMPVALAIVWAMLRPGMVMPNYPLTGIRSSSLVYVQQSAGTLLYSVYRHKDARVDSLYYMPHAEARALQPLWKNSKPMQVDAPKRNIVLFIMESVPADYFDMDSPFRLPMPFMDSIRRHARYYKNAYSYSHHSNKGIVAILAGMPTLTEVPVYHSPYTRLPVTGIGHRLKDSGYTSLFFIGDDYDDFGFAKCVNWLGFNTYYCREDIPGNSGMESHTMGLHDEYVLEFMGNQLQRQRQPFLAVHYNTSTHYPNDLPSSYKRRIWPDGLSPQMKSMLYYDECLKDFFRKAMKEPWFNNTVFLFCSDHWMYPDERKPSAHARQHFRIPIMWYDPRDPNGKNIRQPVSQLDMLNTMLLLSGNKQPFISYGEKVTTIDTTGNRVLYMRENAGTYQALDSQYLLRFNTVHGKAESLFDYKSDPLLRKNVLGKTGAVEIRLIRSMQAFLQQLSIHHLNPAQALDLPPLN